MPPSERSAERPDGILEPVRRSRRVALGSATALVVVCYLAVGLGFLLPWAVTDAEGYTVVGGPGPLLGYGSLLLAGFLGAPLAVVYIVMALLREDWSWARRGTWAVSFWALGPVTMPAYFLKHVRSRAAP